MREWNVIVTVMPGPHHERDLLGGLSAHGRFFRTAFRDVCIGWVNDADVFLEAVQSARLAGKRWPRHLGRVIPIEQVFAFTPDNLAQRLNQATAPMIDRIAGGSFHVRLERRGLAASIPSQEIERKMADNLYALAGAKGVRLATDFEDPDCIIVAETVGNECGIALITRSLAARYPFVRPK
ncbi:MAG: THUMP domain-containing protein [Burkholderiales bacterium]